MNKVYIIFNTYSCFWSFRPQELDEAARRRLVKRLYIPLPENAARKQIVYKLMQKQSNSLTDSDLQLITDRTNGN